ncbi:MAG: hypothetical protein ACOYXA_11265 [Bacteroidota bacterium]
MMKRIILFLLTSVALLSCKEDDDGLTDIEKATILLAKQWDVSSVLLEGTDITNFGYTLSKIQFNADGTWAATNGGSLFSSSGSWTFANDNLNVLNMSGTEVYIALNEQGLNLELRFTLTGATPIGGRVSSIQGDYIVFLLPSYP